MMHLSNPRWAGLVVAGLLALPACAGREPSLPATGRQSPFDLTGSVVSVDVKGVDVNLNLPTAGLNAGASAAFKVDLTMRIESIDPPTGKLCGLGAGDKVVVGATNKTDLAVGQSISNLGKLQDQTIGAAGTAREISSPPGTCDLQASSLKLVQGVSAPSPTPAV